VKLYTLHVDADDEDDARAEVERACRRLLANPVIQDYRIELKRAERARTG
jgi:phosphoribosylformylglycinamidine synthase PurS subunit